MGRVRRLAIADLRMQQRVKMQQVVKLKVPWERVKKRISVFLGNIYRLRAFWEICHPGVAMRFLSVDQKPSWFNNSGHSGTYARRGEKPQSVREKFAKARERYTILTTAQSWCNYGPDSDESPPPICILFKGKKRGRIIRDIHEDTIFPDWLTIQVQ